MILLVPLGSRRPAPHTPWVTVGLVALNLIVFLAVQRHDTAGAEARRLELEQVAEWSLRRASDAHPDLARRAAGRPSALAFLERDGSWRQDLRSWPERERLEACLEDHRALRESDPFHAWGFVPAHVTPVRLVAHLFLHADFLHLLFNMLFLWTVGGLLEARLGPLLFGGGYLAGGAAAALAHALALPGSVEPAIGASGAVAAAMGAFAVLQARERVRLVLVAVPLLVPRVYFLVWPAWVFLGLWLAEQLFWASFGAATLGVAFAAHLGGFGSGLLAGLAAHARGL